MGKYGRHSHTHEKETALILGSGCGTIPQRTFPLFLLHLLSNYHGLRVVDEIGLIRVEILPTIVSVGIN